MNGGECAVCGDPVDAGFECSYCDVRHCTAHRLPEAHGCPGVPQTPTAATGTVESDADSSTQRGLNREDPAEKMERVTTASPESTNGNDEAGEDTPGPREPTFEASSPDLDPDGSLATGATTDGNQPDQRAANQPSTTRRLYHKLRATVRAPFGLLREYVIPLLAVLTVLGTVVGLLILT